MQPGPDSGLDAWPVNRGHCPKEGTSLDEVARSTKAEVPQTRWLQLPSIELQCHISPTERSLCPPVPSYEATQKRSQVITEGWQDRA